MLIDRWLLVKDVLHLNHGSFGATPRAVLEHQDEWRRQFQLDPTSFVIERWEPSIDHARAVLAGVIGARTESLAFVPNTTTGVNAVLRSLEFSPGDEILTTDHVYNACRNVLDHVASRSGARVAIAKVPFPLSDSGEVVEAVMDRVRPRTRFALIDHVTSATGVILPVQQLVLMLEAQGVTVMVDGAHAPGMVPLDLDGLAASYYAGNCHKWLCAPPGTAFLWARPDRADAIHPTVISHGANDRRTDRPRLHLLFDYPGTIDPSGYLSVPAAIAFLSSLHEAGLPGLMQRNRRLALDARQALSDAMGCEIPAPDDMIGSLATIPLPDGVGEPPAELIDPLSRVLFDRWRIQVPVFIWPSWPRRHLRISAAPYNQPEDYERLARALLEEGSIS